MKSLQLYYSSPIEFLRVRAFNQPMILTEAAILKVLDQKKELITHTLENPDTHETRLEKIRALAYLRAKQRGFRPGHEMEDWLAAEKEVNEEFSRQSPRA